MTVGNPERIQRLDVVSSLALEQADRPLGVAGLREIDTELDPNVAVRDAVLQRRFERVNRV